MKKFMFLSVMLLASVVAMAQEPAAKECQKGACPEFNPEKMVEFRAQAIVNKIGMDDATAAKFKDIFKAYVNEVHATFGKECKKACKKAKKDCKQDSARFNMSDADVKAAVKARYAMEKKMITLEEKYFDKFCSIMSARQAQRVMSSIKDGHKNFGKQGKCDKKGKSCDKKGKNCGKQCDKNCGKQCGKQCAMRGAHQAPRGPQFGPGMPGQPCPKACDKKNEKCEKPCEKAA